ncbi:transcriptional regulator [Escherichia coli]|uniref:transcriptional regulator n=1 Tax=Escherichia coli TaxID=562 RepID=UPI002075304F|nr:transcriptional regulator [Escherichia coli]
MDTGKTLTRWPVFVDHFTDIDTHRRMALELNVPLNYFFCDDQTTAELALLISRMTEEERSNLIEALKTSSGVKHGGNN